jgi:ABC-type glycerol-3-phosphate transport system permease component
MSSEAAKQTPVVVGAQAARKPLPVGRIIVYTLVIVLGFLYAFPFYWMVATSLKSLGEMDMIPPTLVPLAPRWENYPEALLQPTRYFPLFFWNTIVMVSLAVVGRLTSNTLIAYAFARIPFKGRKYLFVLVLSTLMIPEAVLLIPQYLIFRQFGWLDSILPLVVPRYFGSAFYIFLLRQFFLTIPKEYDEAAVLDGANHFQIFARIMLPLSGPILITVFALSFVELWNEFFGPLIYINTQSKMVVAMALRLFVAPQLPTVMPWLMAASTVSVLPVIVVFLICQRYFIRGVALTGIKG